MAKKKENKVARFFKNSFQFLVFLFILGFQTTFFFVILYRVMPVPVTPLHLLRVYEQFRDNKEIKLQKSWKSIDFVSDKFCLAVITAEDIKFIQHYGFDFEQIKKSVKTGIKRGKKMRGASTISQQTAKNLFFTPKRSWIRKIPEVIITLAIEVLWTKKRILEVYINIIEMGDGIYGVDAAAYAYFNKSATRLTSRESALIAACLPNPRKYNAGKPNKYIQRKARVIQRYMNQIGLLPWKNRP